MVRRSSVGVSGLRNSLAGLGGDRRRSETSGDEHGSDLIGRARY